MLFRLKGLPERQAFVKKLLAQARQTKDDPSAHYVLLRDARTMASEIGDADTALAATDDMVKAYAVDGLALRYTTLVALGQAAKATADPRPIATALLKVADEAGDAENFEIAEKAAKEALQLATRARDVPLVTRANAALKRTGELKPLRDKIKKAMEDLAANPDDAAANHALGHYKCFLQGKWDEGLPLLTKGKDEALKALAASDLAAPVDTAGQTAVGDAWWT